MLKDYCDGCVFKGHSLFSVHKNGLQILLYFDDIEVVNNLGSHKKVHKLGELCVVYMTTYVPVINTLVVLRVNVCATRRCVLLHPWQF